MWIDKIVIFKLNLHSVESLVSFVVKIPRVGGA